MSCWNLSSTPVGSALKILACLIVALDAALTHDAVGSSKGEQSILRT